MRPRARAPLPLSIHSGKRCKKRNAPSRPTSMSEKHAGQKVSGFRSARGLAILTPFSGLNLGWMDEMVPSVSITAVISRQEENPNAPQVAGRKPYARLPRRRRTGSDAHAKPKRSEKVICVFCTRTKNVPASSRLRPEMHMRIAKPRHQAQSYDCNLLCKEQSKDFVCIRSTSPPPRGDAGMSTSICPPRPATQPPACPCSRAGKEPPRTHQMGTGYGRVTKPPCAEVFAYAKPVQV